MSNIEQSGFEGYCPDVKEWVCDQPCIRGEVILVSTDDGSDAAVAFANAFRLMAAKPEWDTASLSIPDHPPELKEDPAMMSATFKKITSATTDEGQRAERRTRVVIVGSGPEAHSMCSTMRKARIAAVLICGSLGLNMRESAQEAMANVVDMMSFTENFPTEFRFTDLHYQLSMQGARIKDQREQQSRKAHFILKEKKRVARGRSHAKQKHKGVSRFA